MLELEKLSWGFPKWVHCFVSLPLVSALFNSLSDPSYICCLICLDTALLQ